MVFWATLQFYAGKLYSPDLGNLTFIAWEARQVSPRASDRSRSECFVDRVLDSSRTCATARSPTRPGNRDVVMQSPSAMLAAGRLLLQLAGGGAAPGSSTRG